MIALYEPNYGVKIGALKLAWNSKREVIRKIINEKFEISDSINSEQFSEFNPEIRQDIYNSILKNNCMLFLNYDKNDELISLEIHYGISLQLENEVFSFSENLHQQLDNSLFTFDYLDDNEIYFKNMNFSIYNDLFMGGEGNRIGIIEVSRD